MASIRQFAIDFSSRNLPPLQAIIAQGMVEIPSSTESYDRAKVIELWNFSTKVVKLQSNETILQVNQ